MSVEWLEGFDTYKDANDIGRNNYGDFFNFGITTSNPRTGPCSGLLTSGSNGGYIVKTVSTTPSKTIGMAMRLVDNSQFTMGMSLLSGWTNASNWPVGCPTNNSAGVNGFKLFHTSSGNITLEQIVAGVKVPLYTSTNNPIPFNTYFYLELVIDRANSRAQIWYNGNIMLAQISGLTNMVDLSQGAWGQPNGPQPNQNWDDLYITTGERLGAQRCYPLFVSSDETPQDWALSSGVSAFALLDSRSYVTTDYIEGVSAGQKSKFGCQNLAVANANINAIRLCSVQELDSAGSALAKQRAYIGAAQYDGANFSPNITPNYSNDVFTLLGTSVADINGMSLEVEKIS